MPFVVERHAFFFDAAQDHRGKAAVADRQAAHIFACGCVEPELICQVLLLPPKPDPAALVSGQHHLDRPAFLV